MFGRTGSRLQGKHCFKAGDPLKSFSWFLFKEIIKSHFPACVYHSDFVQLAKYFPFGTVDVLACYFQFSLSLCSIDYAWRLT